MASSDRISAARVLREVTKELESKPKKPRIFHSVKLTKRDRDLLGVLATARYLTGPQLHRLMFPGKTEPTSRKRLGQLCGIEHGGRRDSKPFIRRLRYRTWAGQLVSVFTPTQLGYLVAKEELGDLLHVPEHTVGAQFLEHAAKLNELFVGLWAKDGNQPAAPRHSHFRWLASDSARLPWNEYDLTAGKTKPRLIVPDAILEVPALRRRFFIECETGAHTIVPRSEDKLGATVLKAQRYQQFLSSFTSATSKTTFYAERFPDGFEATVVFLVFSEQRKASVAQALKGIAGKPSEVMRPATSDDLIAELCGGPPRSSGEGAEVETPQPAVSPELRLVRQFYNESLAALRLARERLRAAGLEPVAYPGSTEPLRQQLLRGT